MRVIIIHGSNVRDQERMNEEGLPPQNKRHWIPWIKRQLEEKGHEVFTPLMPENWNPKYKDWKKEFEKISVDENTVLIGTSCGGGFLLRWLSETKQKIKKLILVVPSIIARDHLDYLKTFYNFEIDGEIRNRIKNITIFTSDNDKESILESVRICHEKLGGKLIELKGRGHFIMKYMKTEEFPELLEEVLK
jgi:hypothetical protein